MTEQPTPEQPEQAPEPGAGMPRWVPILIGAVLVTLAALAVFTGLRYRDTNTNTITDHVPPRRERTTNAPPGEPEAGASLVLSGNEAPAANEPVTGRARAVVEGGPGGVAATVRIWARRGMVFNVLPEDTMVYVNEMPIGQVIQFNTMDEVYDFAAPGSYTIKLIAPSGAEKTFIVTASEDAKQEIARISAKL